MEKTMYDILRDTKNEIENNFTSDAIEQIQTEGIKRELNRFKATLIKDITYELEHTMEVIQSPVFVGLLGRYSHGKSALVNALFSLDDTSKLPEGEGVVTSKVTRVDFKKDLYTPNAYEVKKGGVSNPIDIETLRNGVGQSQTDTSSVDYFYLNLPTDNRDFAQLFATKNISLIDMPGLGGPYFKDQTTTKQYIKNLDMILAIVKADGIREAGVHIEPYIQTSAGLPVIPVLTFSDLWKKCDLYADCNNEDEMLQKAKSLIQEYIPSLSKYNTNLIAVSSYTGQNINELRSLILNHVEVGNIAIGKARKEISPVYKRQVQQLSIEFNNLKNKINTLNEELDELLKPILPKRKDTNQLKEVFSSGKVQRSYRDLSKEGSTQINECFNKYKDYIHGLRSKNSAKEVMEWLNSFDRDLNNRIFRDTIERVDCLFEEYKEQLRIGIRDALEHMTLDRQKKMDLQERTSDTITEFKVDWKNVFHIQLDSVSLQTFYGKYQAKVAGSTFMEMLKQPMTLVMFIVGIVLGCALPFANLGPWGLLGFIPSLLAVFQIWIQVPGLKKRHLADLKDEIYDYLENQFEITDKKERLASVLEEKKEDLYQSLNEEISSETSEYNRDAFYLKRVKDHLDNILFTMSERIDDEIRNINYNK